MSYNITTTSGASIAVVLDGAINTNSTSLTIVGKNYAGYGIFLNENFVKLLENFSNTTSPLYPLTGQLWFDSAASVLKVYSGTQWKPISSSAAGSVSPTAPVVGDLWWDSTNSQLKVWSGSAWIVVGPAFTSSAGTSGAIVETILDTNNIPRVVVKFYVANTAVAIMSKVATFTPAASIPGFTTISPGMNFVSNTIVPDVKVTADASNALLLSGISANQFLRSDQNVVTGYTVKVQNSGGITVGSSDEFNISTAATTVQLSNTALNGDVKFYVNKSNTAYDAIGIEGATGKVTIKGDLRVQGALVLDQGLNVTGGLSGTVLTPAQPNITSLGTLTTLHVAGTITSDTQILAGGLQDTGTLLVSTAGKGGVQLVGGGGANAAYMSFNRPGVYASYFGLDIDNQFAVGGWNAGAGLAPMKMKSLGVGTVATGTQGEIVATNNITAYYSDERLKTKLGNIENALDKVDRLSGFYYEANEIAQSLGYDVKREVGVSAQEINAIMPEIVAPAPVDNNYMTVRYERLAPLFIEAIKELRTEINAIKQQLGNK